MIDAGRGRMLSTCMEALLRVLQKAPIAIVADRLNYSVFPVDLLVQRVWMGRGAWWGSWCNDELGCHCVTVKL